MRPVQLADAKGQIPDRVQLLKVGTFYDERYGKFEITKSMLRSMAENFKAGVRKIDLSIDFAHDNQHEAGGWMKEVYTLEDDTELWAKVEWTPMGTQKLSDREYRYLSAEFNPDYVDNETQKKHGPTLLGAGLTNRPVIKGMTPAVELSEGDKMKTVEELTKIIETQNAEIKKLSDSIDEMKKKTPASQPGSNPAGGESGNDEDGDEDEDSPAGQISKLKKQLADMETKYSDVSKKCASLEEQMSESKKAKAMAEKESAFAKLLSEGKAVPAQKEAFMAGDMAKYASLQQNVKLAEVGHGGSDAGPKMLDEKDPQVAAQREIIKLAEAKVAEKKATDITSAMGQVLAEREDLRKAYQG